LEGASKNIAWLARTLYTNKAGSFRPKRIMTNIQSPTTKQERWERAYRMRVCKGLDHTEQAWHTWPHQSAICVRCASKGVHFEGISWWRWVNSFTPFEGTCVVLQTKRCTSGFSFVTPLSIRPRRDPASAPFLQCIGEPKHLLPPGLASQKPGIRASPPTYHRSLSLQFVHRFVTASVLTPHRMPPPYPSEPLQLVMIPTPVPMDG